MVGAHSKEKVWRFNQSRLDLEPPHEKRKPDRPKTTSELKKEKIKISSFSDASKRAQSKEDWRTIVRGLRSNEK